jgi:hypothetical protein
MAAERGTAEWWRDRLLKKFSTDLSERVVNAAYYDSINPSPETLERYNSAYRRLLAMSKTPWARLVIDIVAERLTVNGFRIGESQDTDEEVWQTFRRNRMEALQRSVHREALALGTSYVSVWPDPKLKARIAFESGMAVTHETEAGDPHKTAAAIKVWHDSINARVRCNVYLPNGIFKYQSKDEVTDEQWIAPTSSSFAMAHTQWNEGEVIPNPSGVVTMIPFVVRPTWQGYGASDLEDLRPIITRIESLTANTLLAVELGAFRVRWATGLEIPTNEDGDAVEPFKVALDRLWVSGDPDTRFGSFDATDIRPYLSAVSDAVAQLSSVSRIPTLYFNQSELSNPPSAASLEATETGLIKKIVERQDRFAESWEQVTMLATGDKESLVSVSWDDPRTRSEAQMMDAAIKLNTMGVPFQGVLEYLGHTPDEVKRLKAMRSSDTFDRLLQTPLPTATRIEAGQEQPAQAGQIPPAE